MTVASRAVTTTLIIEATIIDVKQEEHWNTLEDDAVVGSDPVWVVDAAVV